MPIRFCHTSIVWHASVEDSPSIIYISHFKKIHTEYEKKEIIKMKYKLKSPIHENNKKANFIIFHFDILMAERTLYRTPKNLMIFSLRLFSPVKQQKSKLY